MHHHAINEQLVPRRRQLARVWLPVVFLTAGSALPARADDWPTPGLDGAHSRVSAERSGADFSDGRWAFAPNSDAGALASPVVADGLVVSARLDGAITALAGDSGKPVWEVSAGAAVQGTPAIAAGKVFVSTLGNRILALALADGRQLWSADLGGMVVSSPAVVDGDIIVGAGLPQQTVLRLSGATGAIRWRTPVMEQFSNTPPAVQAGLVVVGTNGGHYYAFDAATGALRWDYRADGIVNIAAPLIAGGHVYMAGGQDSDRVHAVDAATGHALAGWPIALPTPDPDLTGRRIYRRRSISSFTFAGSLVMLTTRLDDAMDTDANGQADQYLSRETVMALDPLSGTIVWQQPLARVVFTEAGGVPGFVVCPTPAGFASGRGQTLLAVASSLAAKVSIMQATSGAIAGEVTTAGRALASPVVANGRLLTVAEDGTVEARLSAVNHPPAAPVLASYAQPLDAAAVTLRWPAASDPDAEPVSYEVRVDTDGEVLQSWSSRLVTRPGVSSAQLPGPLSGGVTYTFAVRARDGQGAYSAWSAPTTFTVAKSGPVTLDGVPVASLAAAVSAARAGSIVSLGAGTFPLARTLALPRGVRIAGVGAGRTLLDGKGLMVGVTVGGGDGSSPGGLDRLTVSGADTCISVDGSSGEAALTHLVVQDCTTAGVAVAADGHATIKNATILGSGTGVVSSGAATVRDSLLAGNQIGLSVEGDGTLAASYNDLFTNAVDRQGVAPGPGDLAVPVTFANPTAHDFRITGPQASTDSGDPSDQVGDEPAPNGGRINLGAFGGTAEAELSAPAAVATEQPGSPVPTAAPIPPAAGRPGDEAAAGCAVGGSRPEAPLFAMALGIWLAARRRTHRSG